MDPRLDRTVMFPAEAATDIAESTAIVEQLFERERIEKAHVGELSLAYAPIARRIAERRRESGQTLLVGLCGAQGSGKSTAALVLKHLIERGHALRVATLSLDDLYLTAAERESLSHSIHPLFRTRGVPGTHDVGLGLDILAALTAAGPHDRTAIPAFDKATDDRRPAATWPVFVGVVDVVLLEGWFVGARPQDGAALAAPVNRLEEIEDPDGVWRTHSNTALAGRYRSLFDQLDMLIMLHAPSFEHVYAWRREQEVKLAERLDVQRGGTGSGHLMDDRELKRFISHYERLTRHILTDMPDRADILVALRKDRSIASVAS